MVLLQTCSVSLLIWSSLDVLAPFCLIQDGNVKREDVCSVSLSSEAEV